MSRFIYVMNVFDTSVGYLNGDKSGDSPNENKMDVKYYTVEGRTFPRVSSQMYRHMLRRTMTELSGRDYESIIVSVTDKRLDKDRHYILKETKQGNKKKVEEITLKREFFEDFPGQLLFGYMITTQGSNSLTRNSPIQNSHLLGQLDKNRNHTNDFIRVDVTKVIDKETLEKMQKMIAKKELVNNVYIGNIVTELERLGVVEEYEYSSKYTGSREKYDFSDEVPEHLKTFIRAMFSTRGFADQTRSYVNMTPVFSMIVVTDESRDLLSLKKQFVSKVRENNETKLILNLKNLNKVINYYGSDSIVVGYYSDYVSDMVDLTNVNELDVNKYDLYERDSVDNITKFILERL